MLCQIVPKSIDSQALSTQYEETALATTFEQSEASDAKTGTTDTKGRYCFVSLGCPKNLVDSERMLGLLQLDGYTLVQDAEEADFAVVNTCGFIEEARVESYAAI